jgi:hypothetical protein
MNKADPRMAFDLGQAVRRRDDPTSVGYVMAMLLVQPFAALVQWRSGNPTFEPVDGLVEVLQPLL